MIVISRVFVAKNCRSFALSRREENLQMNPFYEKKEEQLHTWVSENMTFPEHLHAHAELLLVLQGQIEVRVMEQAALLGEGDCAVIFPEQIHSYSLGVPNRSQLLIFSPAMAGPYTRAIQKYRPASPFLPSNLLPEDVFLSFRRLLALSQGQYPLPPCSANVCTGLGSAWIHVLLSLLIPLLSLEDQPYPPGTRPLRHAHHGCAADTAVGRSRFQQPAQLQPFLPGNDGNDAHPVQTEAFTMKAAGQIRFTIPGTMSRILVCVVLMHRSKFSLSPQECPV